MGLIKNITFETGDFSQCDGTTGTGISVVAGAALAGTSYGLSVNASGTNPAYCYSTSMNNTSGLLGVRFYMDPNNFFRVGVNLGLFIAHNNSGSQILKIYSYSYDVYWRVYFQAFDDVSYNTYDMTDLADEPILLEAYMKRATTSSSSDGSFKVIINDSVKYNNTAIDNYDTFSSFNRFWFGKPTADILGVGTYYLDQLAIRDDDYRIGPFVRYISPDYGFATPTISNPVINIGYFISPSPTDASIIVVEPIVHEGSQSIYASEDSIDGQWTNELGNNTNLYDSINESSSSDADFISSPVLIGDHETCRMKLASAVDPSCNGGHIITLRFKERFETGYITNLIVRLLQGDTTIAQKEYSDIGATITEDSFALNPSEADSITDYTNLYIEFEAYGG